MDCMYVCMYVYIYICYAQTHTQALKPADRGGRIEVKGLSKHKITGVQQGG